MADTTPVYNLPFLELADPPDIAGATEGLATAVEAELVRIDADVAGLTRLQWKYTTGDLSTPINAAWGNIAGFSFAAEAGKVYAIDCVLFLENPSASTVDVRFGWSWTGTGVMTSGQSGLDTTVDSPAYNGGNTAHAIIADATSPLDESTGIGTPAAIETVARVAATYQCTTAGTVQMRFRQDTTSATIATRVRHGSRMRAERMN
jgi:hypothetical protein